MGPLSNRIKYILILCILSDTNHIEPKVYFRTRMTPKRLRCFVVGCNNEHSSNHLLLTSELLKMIKFGSEGNAPSVYLNASMFVRIIRDPASPTEEVSTSFFFFFMKSPFLIMCKLASFMMNAAKVNNPSENGSEERGGVSRAQQHLKENDTIWLALKRAVFERVKKVFFTLPVKNLNQTMLQTFH